MAACSSSMVTSSSRNVAASRSVWSGIGFSGNEALILRFRTFAAQRGGSTRTTLLTAETADTSIVSVVTSPRAQARPTRAATPQARIVAGARRHFFAHGFRGVTMDELARELGMSKKTLYVSFPGKRDLLRAVIANKAEEIGSDLEQITSGKEADFS